MKLHVFNPEHDIALAARQEQFTPPHAGRQLRRDLGFIPALWADNGDFVLVDDIDQASEKMRHLDKYRRHRNAHVEFITMEQLKYQREHDASFDVINTAFSPWGWDMSVAHQLGIKKANYFLLHLDEIRNISSRQWTATHLQHDVEYIDDVNVLKARVSEMRRCVVKSPWSSSGRGVKFVDLDMASLNDGWASNIIRKQGGIVVEPYYNKVKDFGMEFIAKADGTIEYCGLSLFYTVKGAYSGNIIANEDVKENMLMKYIGLEKVALMRSYLIDTLGPELKGIYEGPFGVDLMVTAEGSLEIAEMNLRRTMGHVALSITPEETLPVLVMHVSYDGSHYHLRVNQTLEGVEFE